MTYETGWIEKNSPVCKFEISSSLSLNASTGSIKAYMNKAIIPLILAKVNFAIFRRLKIDTES